MKGYKKVEPNDYNLYPFKDLDQDWLLITSAKKDGIVNTMTASWAGFGFMWDKPLAIIMMRPQRYTNEFVEDSHEYSLCFFGNDYKKDLAYLGEVSGRDEDKISKTSLTTDYYNGIPYFKEARLVMFCESKAMVRFTEETFYDKELVKEQYPLKDFHNCHWSEVIELFRKE